MGHDCQAMEGREARCCGELGLIHNRNILRFDQPPSTLLLGPLNVRWHRNRGGRLLSGSPPSILNTKPPASIQLGLNRNLLVFSLFMIVVGVFFGFYLVSFLGLLVLIPALVASSNPPPRPQPSSAKQPPRRVTPPQATDAKAEVAPPVQSMSGQMSIAAIPPPTQPQTYSPALFPSSFMPTLSQMGTYPQMTREPQGPKKQEERDELVEVGSILVLLKLVFG